ncbi:response regulator transcription factor [Kitasatospora sp. GP82]|uniref:response regulator transcription factor n=1 Tax=Kitasatospora sp. GP82 TaxID=3035089 RepID=UPI0024737A32|nr:response regulator transcription factor [Kitasatospora sp. GP82]MDH6130013.1 two-component system response regulator DesR [Kitasatospora sp. GP82]
MTTRILLADDHVMILDALRGMLETVDGFEVVASVSNPDEIVRTALATRPSVAIMDVCMPPRDGLSIAVELRQNLPRCAVALVSATPDTSLVRRAISLGVLGFIPKSAGFHQLIAAVRAVAEGQLSIDPTLIGALTATECPLTSREIDVLKHTATGASVSDIAGALFLAPGTVRNLTSAAIKKLNARNRFDAVLIATDRGWLH